MATVWPGSLPSCSLASSRSHGQHSDRDILSRAAGAAGGRFPTHCQTVTASDSSSPDPPAGHGHPIISCQDSDQAATPRVRPGTDETGPAGLGGSARLPCRRSRISRPGPLPPCQCHCPGLESGQATGSHRHSPPLNGHCPREPTESGRDSGVLTQALLLL